MKTIVGSFDSFEEAKRVSQDLMDEGFRDGDVNVVASNLRGDYAGSAAGDYTRSSTDATLPAGGEGLVRDRVVDKDVADDTSGAAAGAVTGGGGGRSRGEPDGPCDTGHRSDHRGRTDRGHAERRGRRCGRGRSHRRSHRHGRLQD